MASLWTFHSGRKIPEELTPLKVRILQKRSSPQLDDEAVFAVMDAAEELAYNSEGPTNKILRTPMFPLGYGGLVEGGNTQWNTVAMPNNPQCDNKQDGDRQPPGCGEMLHQGH